MTCRVKKSFLVLAVSFFMACFLPGPGRAVSAEAAEITEPVQVTAETDPVVSMDVSENRAEIIYITETGSGSALWRASADPAEFELPEKLLTADSEKRSAAVSSSAEKAAYVDTRFDARGDIYLLDLKTKGSTPVRLTGRDAAEADPEFSPDGNLLYFQRKEPDGSRHLAVIDLSRPDKRAERVPEKGEAMSPAASPDGKSLAFISGREHPSGDVFTLDLETGAVRQLTSGPAIDAAPAWSADGKAVYFSRISADTSGDGQLSEEDNSVVCRIYTARTEEPAYPVTPLNRSASGPCQAGKRIYYISDRAGTPNCWAIEESGPVQGAESAEAQAALAEKTEEMIPASPFMSLLAWYRVMERYPENAQASAGAGLKTGEIYQEQNLLFSALKAYKNTAQRFPSVLPHGPASEIRSAEVSARIRISREPLERKRIEIFGNSIREIDRTAQKWSRNKEVRTEALLAKARLAVEAGFSGSKIAEARRWLEQVQEADKADPLQKAEALFLKGLLYKRSGLPGNAGRSFRELIRQYPDAQPWAYRAAQQALDSALSDIPEGQPGLEIKRLQQIADKNRELLPALSLAALNRTGDIYYAEGRLDSAKSAYRTVIEQSPGVSRQSAAARLSLAEIFYRQERFREALDLYEKEIHLRPAEDRIYRLARQGYIEKTLSAGEFHYSLGEIAAAKNTFRELIDYDETIVEAHRGYIKCRAAAGKLEKTIDFYKKKLEENPDAPLRLYTAGLAVSYRDTEEALETAAEYIRKAIRLNGSVPWFHQSLGYINEALETVYQHEGRLEKALASYKKAYFLLDTEKNPGGAADLELNLGNSYYLLGQYGKALEFYTRRLERKEAFSEPRREIAFYKRLGESAFQAMDTEKARYAYKKALEKIDNRMDPLAPARAFDRLHRIVRDRILAPALKLAGLEERAKDAARKQADISSRVSACAEAAKPPPGEAWNSYSRELKRLIKKQEELNSVTADLAEDLNRACASGRCRARLENPADRLALLTGKISERLSLPEELAVLQTEMTGRLGLACQELGRYEEAAEAFEAVYELNKKQGSTGRLAGSLRAAACNTYYCAEESTGEKRRRLLEKAQQDFRQVLELIEKYGVAEAVKEKGGGLVNISIQAALEKGSATEAAHGFSRDQEIRLAQAFLSRIALELGELETARKNLESQLSQYPVFEPVDENNRYGVAILYHRAGLLAYAEGDYETAWRRFLYSADLCTRMQAPASAAANMTNLASVLEALFSRKQEIPELDRRLKRLEQLDRKSTSLMKNSEGFRGSLRLAEYHNTMAVCFSLAAGKTGGKDAESAVVEMHRLSLAAGHLSEGLEILEGKDFTDARRALEAKARLHLNTAAVSMKTGDRGPALSHLEKALEASKQGVLPDLKWRALAGSGRLEDALDALSAVTPARAGCSRLEIIRAFGPLVLEKFRSSGAEAAFNLAEKISELERFNRTAFVIRPESRAQKSLYKKLFPRLSRIKSLKEELNAAPEDKKPYVGKRLETELSLLEKETGSLPGLVSGISDAAKRKSAVLAIGAFLRAEETARELAEEKQKDKPDMKALIRLESRRNELLETFRRAAEQTGDPQDRKASGIRALLIPEPAGIKDAARALEKKECLFRIFPTGRKEPAYLVFILEEGSVSARTFDGIEEVRSFVSDSAEKGPAYAAYEDPAGLGLEKPLPLVFSAAHLLRSFSSRKPFKHRLMCLSDSLDLKPHADNYEILELEQEAGPGGPAFSYSLAAADTLVFPHPVSAASRVPAASGEKAGYFIAAYTGKDSRTGLAGLLSETESLSFSVLADADLTELDRIMHLFSIYGCPSAAVLNPDIKEKSRAVDSLLASYSRAAGFEAASGLGDSMLGFYFGHRGMGPEEAQKFGKKRFAEYVRTGRKAYDIGRTKTALVNFSNAAEIAEQMDAFSRYLPALYQYARESAYKSGSLEKALSFAQKLVEILESRQPDSSTHAEALLTQGLINAKLSRYDKAVPVIEDAVEMFSMLQADKKLAKAMSDLGVVLENATNYESALARFRKAAELTERMGSRQMLAAQHINIGRIYDLRLNRYPEAINHYEEALSLYRELGDAAKTAEASLNIGRCCRLLGVFTKAESFYESALGYLEKSTPDSPGMRAKILMEQANNAWFQGDFERAFRIQRKALKLAEENSLPLVRVMAGNTSGLIWWSLGDYEKALSELDTALETAQELSIRRDEVASTLNNTGLVYREMGEYEKALETFDKALAIDREMSSKWAMAYDYRNKALARLRMGQPEKALPLFEKALSLSNSIGNRINSAKALLGKGNALLETGSADDAKASFSEALKLSAEMGIKETRWRALYGLARISREIENDPETAENYLKKALEIIESMRAAIHIKALKENFMVDRLSVYKYLAGLLADMGKPAEAFETAERSRSRNFIDLLGTQRISLAGGTEEELYKKHGILRSEIEAAEKLLAAAETPSEKEAYKENLEELKNRLDNLEKDIQAKHPELSTLVSIPPVGIHRITGTLEPGVALLSYYVLDTEILCWVIKHESADNPLKLFRVPADSDELEARVKEYRRIIQNLQPWESHSEALYKDLAAPVRDELEGIHTVGIIPHGPLHYLSWATLYSGERFMIDDFSLFYLPSTSVLEYTTARRIKRPKLSLKVLALGNPDLENPALELDFAEPEVNSIKWNFPEITVLTGERAAEAWVVENIAEFDIIHIASHGEFDPVNPLMSALKLSPGEGKDSQEGIADGDLRAAEVFGLDINADMVCMSACQTGLGKIKTGDEIIGLNRSFFYAGTHTVISSLWRVSDVSTAMLVKTFYRRYTAQNKADSLRDAALHVRQFYTHPAYWGAFTLVGDFK